MKLSTKGRYGLQAMVDLAVYSKEKHVSLKSISERLSLSENYLEQLIALLKKNGLVSSVRGAQGGYFLAKPPEEITIGEILRALEGSLAPTDCTCESNTVHCALNGKCVTRSVWEKIRDSINKVVDNITLKQLMDDYEKINENASSIYYI
ncbi:Rrf2 family transcriptional regulator [Sporanaerobium hydrogeniformans]|uniref:Rrf2 family transcriptional regulator n=1 Tax=Sporanaerobium hydrogeniformans TaxID=3072179 RepID=A0AC61DIC1_9FIRM|nr:Rrf2 family transcriptional regulator [Sporanaerobium hydrogeniformans]PHV72097.1 Rrf2 family transcriptional regulator [Sporanaerobium hydrogeniformans]